MKHLGRASALTLICFSLMGQRVLLCQWKVQSKDAPSCHKYILDDLSKPGNTYCFPFSGHTGFTGIASGVVCFPSTLQGRQQRRAAARGVGDYGLAAGHLPGRLVPRRGLLHQRGRQRRGHALHPPRQPQAPPGRAGRQALLAAAAAAGRGHGRLRWAFGAPFRAKLLCWLLMTNYCEHWTGPLDMPKPACGRFVPVPLYRIC